MSVNSACQDERAGRELRIASVAKAVSNPVRVRLLSVLREPLALSEIEVSKPGDARDKPLARQTVKRHLETLIDVGLVATRRAERSYGETTEYLLDHRRLYTVSEVIRAMASVPPKETPECEPVDIEHSWRPADPGAPHLILVKGAHEGETFPFPGSEGRWVLGRAPGADVSLHHDCCVSEEQCLIRKDASRCTITELSGARNGTVLGSEMLVPGKPRELSHGDILKVGRSVLVFRR